MDVEDYHGRLINLAGELLNSNARITELEQTVARLEAALVRVANITAEGLRVIDLTEYGISYDERRELREIAENLGKVNSDE